MADIPAVMDPPPELIKILIGGGAISKLRDKLLHLDSNSPNFLFNSLTASLVTPE